jgi:hypothetical protein
MQKPTVLIVERLTLQIAAWLLLDKTQAEQKVPL